MQQPTESLNKCCIDGNIFLHYTISFYQCFSWLDGAYYVVLHIEVVYWTCAELDNKS